MMEIPLTQGYVALVDDEDYGWLTSLGKWQANPHHRTVYARRSTTRDHRKVQMKMHRLILPGFEQVDHINGDGLDNRRANLRGVTNAQNALNRGVRRGTQSGYRGVTRAKSGRWQPYISVDGRVKWLGTYETPEEAARVRDAAAIEFHGPFARLNFPQERTS